MEGLDYWNRFETAIQDAWKEWSLLIYDGDGDDGEEKDDDEDKLFLLDDSANMIHPQLHDAVHDLWKDPTLAKEDQLKDPSSMIFQQEIPGVWTCHNFFTEAGIRSLRHHLELAAQAPIPKRRPNGMNRNGLVLDVETPGGVGSIPLLTCLKWLVDIYIRPLGRMMFPEYSGKDQLDDIESYAFTIHYDAATNSTETSDDPQLDKATTPDTKLPEHSDASVYTLNVNLNLPEDGPWEGSTLDFVVDDTTTTTNTTTKSRQSLQLQPGMAILHRGLHRHQAHPITKGQRHQLVIWIFGEQGYVRFVPYEPHEQRNVQERWTKPKIARQGEESLSSASIIEGDKEDAHQHKEL